MLSGSIWVHARREVPRARIIADGLGWWTSTALGVMEHRCEVDLRGGILRTSASRGGGEGRTPRPLYQLIALRPRSEVWHPCSEDGNKMLTRGWARVLGECIWVRNGGAGGNSRPESCWAPGLVLRFYGTYLCKIHFLSSTNTYDRGCSSIGRACASH